MKGIFSFFVETFLLIHVSAQQKLKFQRFFQLQGPLSVSRMCCPGVSNYIVVLEIFHESINLVVLEFDTCHQICMMYTNILKTPNSDRVELMGVKILSMDQQNLFNLTNQDTSRGGQRGGEMFTQYTATLTHAHVPMSDVYRVCV